MNQVKKIQKSPSNENPIKTIGQTSDMDILNGYNFYNMKFCGGEQF